MEIAREIVSLASFGKVVWNCAVSMEVETGDRPTSGTRRVWRNLRRNQRKAIKQHQHNEWRKAMYRRVNDISKKTRPSLKKYAWYFIEKSATRP